MSVFGATQGELSWNKRVGNIEGVLGEAMGAAP